MKPAAITKAQIAALKAEASVSTIHTRDTRLVAETVAEAETATLERLFDSVIDARYRLTWHAHLPSPTKEDLVQFMGFVLSCVFEARDNGLVISHPRPVEKTLPKLPVLIAQIVTEKYDGNSEAAFDGLTKDFEAYLS